NVLTYDGWLANRWLATVTEFTDGADPTVFGWGVAVNLAWLARALVPALPSTGWVPAGVALGVMLAPGLPLASPTYHYYMVAALPAAGLMAASLFALLLGRIPRAVGWAVAASLAALFAWDGRALVWKIEHMPFKEEGLRADPTVDRARIAANVLTDLGGVAFPARTHLRFWSPQVQAMSAREGVPSDREGYYQANLRPSLLDGLAVRTMVPGVDTVTFERTFAPADSQSWWAVYRYDRHLKIMRAGELVRAIGARSVAPHSPP